MKRIKRALQIIMKTYPEIQFLFFFTILISSNALSQSQSLNYGLSEKQDPLTLPKSDSKIIWPGRKAKVNAKPELISVSANEWKLCNGWEMADALETPKDGKLISSSGFNTGKWYNATVPGTALATLVQQGVYPDPYYGLNNLVIPDTLAYKHWWYRTILPIPEALKKRKVELLFNGINYRAEVWLNGVIIGKINGAFVRGIFDITERINFSGENVLAVHIYPTEHPGIAQEASPRAGAGENGGALCYDGPTFISSEGWDWVPGIRDRNVGIWQDVRIVSSGEVKLIDPFVITDVLLPDTTKAVLTIETELKNTSNHPKQITLSGKIEAILVTKKITLQPQEKRKVVFDSKEFPQLNMNNPRLWWPNGYGKPDLYYLQLVVADESGDTSDVKTIRFGIRELAYDLSVNYKKRKNVRVEFNPIRAVQKRRKPLFDNMPLKNDIEAMTLPRMRIQADTLLLEELKDQACAPYLVFKVNGQRIFCKGGNWGMDDGMKNSSREHLEPYVRLHRDEHFTMLRNWTGESTEEALYELCDEYGLLVWNEFWATTQYYNVDPWDNQLFLDNVKETVKRFRNHPSIAIWGARNEGFPAIVLEDSLRWTIAMEDPTRHYQPTSRYLNLRMSGPWSYVDDQKEYFTKISDGFSTEMGTVSVPTAETMRKFIPKEDLWPNKNDTWYYHDYNFGEWTNIDGYAKTINDKFGGEPGSLDEFCGKAQLLNYESYRNIFESFNSKLWTSASGLLLWMSHPAWPSTLWQTYSYDYETHGAYYGSKKACEPIHIQMNLHDDKVLVVNTSLKHYDKANSILQVYDVNGALLYVKEAAVKVSANGNANCFTPEFPEKLPETYLVRLTLKDQSGAVLSTSDYWRNSASGKDFTIFNTLHKVALNTKMISRTKDHKSVVFKIKNTSNNVGVSIKLNLRDVKTNNSILPVYFSDGYFNLLPGEEKVIKMDCPSIQHLEGLKLTAEGYNLKLQDLKVF